MANYLHFGVFEPVCVDMFSLTTSSRGACQIQYFFYVYGTKPAARFRNLLLL